jgi:hypothetical protein
MSPKECRAKLVCIAKQPASDNASATSMVGQGLIPFHGDLLGSLDSVCKERPTLDFERKENSSSAN